MTDERTTAAVSELRLIAAYAIEGRAVVTVAAFVRTDDGDRTRPNATGAERTGTGSRGGWVTPSSPPWFHCFLSSRRQARVYKKIAFSARAALVLLHYKNVHIRRAYQSFTAVTERLSIN